VHDDGKHDPHAGRGPYGAVLSMVRPSRCLLAQRRPPPTMPTAALRRRPGRACGTHRCKKFVKKVFVDGVNTQLGFNYLFEQTEVFEDELDIGSTNNDQTIVVPEVFAVRPTLAAGVRGPTPARTARLTDGCGDGGSWRRGGARTCARSRACSPLRTTPTSTCGTWPTFPSGTLIFSTAMATSRPSRT